MDWPQFFEPFWRQSVSAPTISCNGVRDRPSTGNVSLLLTLHDSLQVPIIVPGNRGRSRNNSERSAADSDRRAWLSIAGLSVQDLPVENRRNLERGLLFEKSF